MATSQMRQISSGTASCPLFLTNFGTCAGTLTFVAFIHQYKPPSPSLAELPQKRGIFIFHRKKNKEKLFFPLSNLGLKLLCAATFSTDFFPAKCIAREMWKQLHTCTHTCTHKHRQSRVAGGGGVSVSGSQPWGYNGKAKNDRACGLLNILFDFA